MGEGADARYVVVDTDDSLTAANVCYLVLDCRNMSRRLRDLRTGFGPTEAAAVAMMEGRCG